MIADFLCWMMFVALLAAFLLSLAVKWRVLEWMQVHAPCDLINEMLNCKFCTSFWMGVVISLILCVVIGNWWLIAIPICSTIITRELW